MGRNKIPLSMQKGNLTVEAQDKMKQIDEMTKSGIEQVKCPTWVKNKDAKKEFKRLCEQLLLIEAITNLDLNNLAQYCVAYGNYVQATMELTGQPLTTSKQLPNGSYQIIPNPLIKIQKDYADEMRKFASMCGLTFDSRAKMADLRIEKEKDQVGETFGNI